MAFAPNLLFVFVLIWVGAVLFLRLKKHAGLVFLLFFTVFCVYLFKVLDYTLFQFQSLLLLRYFVPGLILQGQAAGESVNLIPLIALGMEDLKTSLLNILLMVPFGFGLPFVTDLRMKKVVLAGMVFSIAIELVQLVTGFMAGISFRIADINDVLFNTLGAAIGYVLFVGVVRAYRHVSHGRKSFANPVFRYVAERPQLDG